MSATLSASAPSKDSVDPTRLGIYAPTQPVSGITSVNETFAVNGMGRGAYVRMEKTDQTADKR
jgi:hypothetical protein